jgi:cysteine sulfinate desulfinase/cysteine desulfurase-like protein
MSETIKYFDANGTTPMCDSSKKALYKLLESSNYDYILDSKVDKIIESTIACIADHCNINIDPAKKNSYSIIFTSGATESNCMIIKACMESFKRIKGLKGHLIISEYEHSNVLDLTRRLEDADICDVTYVKPDLYGLIDPDLYRVSIIPGRTALMSCMFINNEIGTINNIELIGKYAHDHRIPFHTDAVQGFGKFRLMPLKHNIDALTFSTHKIYGSSGSGVCIVSNDLLNGYKLHPLIPGSQQNEHRGGTHNIMGIVTIEPALKYCFNSRLEKNNHLYDMKKYFITEMTKYLPLGRYENYVIRNELTKLKPGFNSDFSQKQNINLEEIPIHIQKKDTIFKPIEFVLLGPQIANFDKTSPNTLLVSIAKNKVDTKGPFCNIKLKNYLKSKKIIVSIGSKCHINSSKASHVLTAIDASTVIKQGTLRISFLDSILKSEVSLLVKVLIDGINKQLDSKLH